MFLGLTQIIIYSAAQFLFFISYKKQHFRVAFIH